MEFGNYYQNAVIANVDFGNCDPDALSAHTPKHDSSSDAGLCAQGRVEASRRMGARETDFLVLRCPALPAPQAAPPGGWGSRGTPAVNLHFRCPSTPPPEGHLGRAFYSTTIVSIQIDKRTCVCVSNTDPEVCLRFNHTYRRVCVCVLNRKAEVCLLFE